MKRNADVIKEALSSADEKEFQKCKDSPVYFYNTYVRRQGEKEITQEEYENFVKMVEYKRNSPPKPRRDYKDCPLMPNQCYKKI